MVPSPSVLISLSGPDDDLAAARGRLERVVRGRGYEPRFTTDAGEAMAWAREQRFAVSFVDADMEVHAEGRVWRVLHQVIGPRMVLMTRGRRQDVWFEALKCGVAAVLPLPPRTRSVRAALEAAVGPER
jgi:ActR/RegA family two-component response regulator